MALVATFSVDLGTHKNFEVQTSCDVRLEEFMSRGFWKKPWKWYTVYGILCHMHNSVTYLIWRHMLGYIDD